MDLKSSDIARCRRKTRTEEDDRWECGVCTYVNPSESYKCEICFMRKGTSTRKPRLNPQVVEQQQLIAQAILKEKDEDNRKKRPDKNSDKNAASAPSVKLKNFDRSSPLLFEIFANGYSVIITEFQLKSKVKPHFPDSPAASNCSSLQGFTGTPNAIPEQPSPADSTCTPEAVHQVPQLAEFEHYDTPDAKSTSHFVFSEKSTNSCLTRSVGLMSQPIHSHSSVSSCVEDVNFCHTNSPNPQSTPCSSTFNHSKMLMEQTTQDGDNNEDDSRFSCSRSSFRPVARSTNPRYVPDRLAKEQARCSHILLPERVPTSPAIKLVISPSRRKRFKLDESKSHVSPTVPVKQRKVALGRTRLKSNQLTHRRSSTPDRPVSTSTSRQKSSRARPSRVSVDQLTSTARKQPRASVRSCSSKRSRSTKRHSSTPVELKCKIRVLRTPDQVLTPPFTTDKKPLSGSDSTTEPLDQVPRTCSLPDGMSDTSLEHSLVDSNEAGSNILHRLSTESKNTSAMTDSGGATALEIPG